MMAVTYIGTELELFATAQNWKNYYSQFLKPSIHGQVLEVGAGIGETTKVLHTPSSSAWLCLEPDPTLAQKIQTMLDQRVLPHHCTLLQGTIQDLPSQAQFDSIVYIDVLEHIEADQQQLSQVSQYLKPNGFLIILVPAHQFLYSPFDAAIGHFRRYNRTRLQAIIPKQLQPIKCQYLDSIGLLASLANRLLLKHSTPTQAQINLWDHWMIPASRLIDPLLRYRMGKTLIGIWQSPGS